MANANSTPVSDKTLDARDLLEEASHIAKFIQGVSLNHEIHLEPGEVTGFYFILQDLIGRIDKANLLLDDREEVQA
ncbi:hypothetical protein C8R32_10875 [Nitrosospira sp. Nsp5]|uniref:Uncharacterized protein n=1 Tax=Nitrosospira multiformis TaxID=1231 RepID=A0ABY0T6J7_9PROT|nr:MULTISPECIES: hypothetical protein [Nitrosospira]PTR07119.1 hypothetical protein C8R32_10875 [Nitrosospira sp. Nsp5]SDQ33908.1 hypothetical protein SAMN05216402_0452 [Nitrosospira multiformis]